MWQMLLSLCLTLSGKPLRKAPPRRRPAFRRPLLETLEDRALPSAYMVTTAADNGDNTNPIAGSLRAAIEQVNAGLDNEIDFNITSGSGYNSITGVATIAPLTELPPIANPVLINGYTQGQGTPLAASMNMQAVGDNAVLKIELDGSLITPTPWLAGLTITADSSVVEGLDIHSFYSSPSTFPSMGIWLRGGSNDHIQGNFIGTDIFGTSAPDGLPDYSSLSINGAMSYGVHVSDGAHNNWIGAVGISAANDTADRNIISATGVGVVLRGLGVDPSTGNSFVPADGDSNNNVVAGNYIGTDLTGTDALGNWAGIVTLQGTSGDHIGTNGTDTDAAGEGNLISGNNFGIAFAGGAFNIPAEQFGLVAGNVIGLNAEGDPLGNLFAGIGASELSYGITIGGTTSTLANIIADNGGPGIWLGYFPYFDTNGAFLGIETATGIQIEGNSIHNNGGLGIDLGGIYGINGPDGVTLNDSYAHFEPTYFGFQATYSPNDFQDFPVLASAVSSSTDTSITGTFSSGTVDGTADTPPFEPDTPITLDFYANPSADPSGYGQGQTYLGTTTIMTDDNGNVTFTADLSVGGEAGQWITATAIDPNEDTSEFALDVQATAASSQTYAQYLQGALPQSSTTANSMTIQTSVGITPATVIAAVNGLTNVADPVTVILDLGGGTYSTDGVAADPPANVSVVVQNGTLDPATPALTVAGGQVSVLNCTLTTTGNAPALLVTGGNVTLSNDDIVQASTVFTDPAIAVTGGTVNLGTPANPGHNTVSVNNSGDLVTNTSNNPISTTGDTFQVGGTVETATSLSFTRLTASAADTIPGQTVTLTATVTPNMTGSTTPTGTVDFYDTTTNTDLGTAPLSGGVASLSTSPLSLGNHVIQATYRGDGNYLPSVALLTQTVEQSIDLLNTNTAGALSLSGNASIQIAGVVEVDSSSANAITLSGNAQVSAAAVQEVGGYSATGNAHFKNRPTHHAAFANPLAGLNGPTGGTTRGSVNIGGNTVLTINPGVYSAISVSGNARLTLNPGVYIITGGGLTVTGNASVSGSGVLIYNGGSGAISLSGNAQVNLTAANNGAYAGIVIFQASNNTSAISVSGNAVLGLSGNLLYASAAMVSVSGNGQMDASLVVNELQLSGNGTED